MFGKLALGSGREISVCGVLFERTGIHMNAFEPWPQIVGRFQLAAADLHRAAMRLAPKLPVVLVDEWARYFEMPYVLEHPIKTFDRWKDFTPPQDRKHPPRWVCAAWLSSTPIDPDDLGSDLVAAWCADAVVDLDAEIVAAASTIAWERHAVGYSF